MGRHKKKFDDIGIHLPVNLQLYDIFSFIKVDFSANELAAIKRIKERKEEKRCKRKVY